MNKSNSSKLAIERMQDFEAVKYLVDEETINAYLNDVKQANDPALSKLAMQNVEQARLINSNKK